MIHLGGGALYLYNIEYIDLVIRENI